MEHESRSEALKHADLYLRGREVSTIAIYGAEYKKLVKFCMKFGEVLFGFKERGVVKLHTDLYFEPVS